MNLLDYTDSEFEATTGSVRRRLPLGCDKQGRYPEAAHAASEYEDEAGAEVGMSWWVKPVLILCGFSAALLGVAYYALWG